jgi:hypothetical protein
MGGRRGSGGVVPGDTDLSDLRGHPQSRMSSRNLDWNPDAVDAVEAISAGQHVIVA